MVLLSRPTDGGLKQERAMYARIASARVVSPNSPRVASLGTDLRRLCDEASRGAFGHYCEDCGVRLLQKAGAQNSIGLFRWAIAKAYVTVSPAELQDKPASESALVGV